ncbi:MAG: hypothetical protein WC378_16940 [Opitutaceae bacterium]|jgi:hypothetical protein
MNPSAMTCRELADVMSAALRTMGRPAVAEADVAALAGDGLPTNEDGTVGLLTLAAWLAKTEIQKKH